MLPDICNSDTSTVISEGYGEFLPCCGSCTSDTVYAEIHPGASVKELFRRKGASLRCNSITYSQSRNRLKKSASRLAHQCKRRYHHQHQHQRTPFLYDLYVLKSEDTDTDTSGKTAKEPKDIEVRKTRSNGEPAESTSRHSRRVVPLKKPSVLCVPRVCQPDPSIMRHKHSRSRNCRLCHHHYCSWMKEDFLHSRFAERGRKSTSGIPEAEPLNRNISSSLKESVHSAKHDLKKSYVENEFHCVASELNALLQKCEREIVDKGASEQASSKQDPPAISSLQPRVPLSIQRKLKEQMKQTTGEPPGQHGNQPNVLTTAESRGTQTRQPLNFNDHPFSKMCYETNTQEQWFESQQNSSLKCENSRVYDDERNSVATEGTSEEEYHYSPHDIVGSPVQQKEKPSPRNSPKDRKEERENVTEHIGKLERGILEKHLYDPKPYYEQELQFRRGSQGDGPISSNTSNAETVIHRSPSPKPRKSRCESLKKPPVLPYCLEPQNVFFATCNRRSTGVEYPHQNLKDTPRSSREQHNKWIDDNEFCQHQQGQTANETLTVVSVPLQTMSEDNSSITGSLKNTSQDPQVPKSPPPQLEKPGNEKPELTEMLEDLDSYLRRMANDPKHQQESAEGSKPLSESNATQGKRSFRMSKNGRPFKSRSLTSICLPNYTAPTFESGDYKPCFTHTGLYEERNDKEEEQINSLEPCIASVTTVHTAVKQEIRAFADRSPNTAKEAQDIPPSEGATVKANFMERIDEATAKEQNVQPQDIVKDNTSCTINESFSDIYKMGLENNAMYTHLMNILPGEEAHCIREIRRLQWDHLSRIKYEIQSLEELVRFLDNYGSEHVLCQRHSAPT